MKHAKDEAKGTTRPGCVPQAQLPSVRSTTLGLARARLRETKRMPENVGKYSLRVDKALPGEHTRQLYDHLTHEEASILAQLRKGMARANTYLHRIGAAATDECDCGHAKEIVEHEEFLPFRCSRWTQYRREMMELTASRRGNISFYLGGKEVPGCGWETACCGPFWDLDLRGCVWWIASRGQGGREDGMERRVRVSGR